MRRRLLLSVILAASTASTLSAQPKLVLQQIGTWNQPVALTHAGDDRLFITEQSGRVMIAGKTTPFLDIRTLVSCCDERGLLSVAFHPKYSQNGFFYVDYTDRNGNTVVARYSVLAGDPNRADPASAKVILTVDQPFSNHNGGQLQFGFDGYLYIGMGDGGSAGDPGNRAQNLTTLLGKLLRIDVDSGDPYSIPSTNPFASTNNARGEIWAYGLRNPWRFTFDRRTGDMWIGDVGQGAWEEVDWQLVTSPGGENYGWRLMEGKHCFNPSTNCPSSGLTAPVVEYSHGGGNCSVTGGYRYRGETYPRMSGMYIYGDYCSGMIWGATPQHDGTVTTQLLLDTTIQISSFGEDVRGELYVLSLGGNVYRLTDPSPPIRRIVRR
jgi:glucose/arabinose dehydrogenase